MEANKIVVCLVIFGALLAVSVSAGIDDLKERLQQIGYDRFDRPKLDDGHIEVMTQIYIYSFGPVKEDTFTFQICFLLRQWWNDPRLQTNNTKETITLPKIKHILWIPDTYIVNGRSGGHFLSERAIIQPNGNVYMSNRVMFVCNCDMVLENFPMDVQECPLIMESYSFNQSSIRFAWQPIAVLSDDYKHGLELVGHIIQNISWRRMEINYDVGVNKEVYSSLMVLFKLSRTFSYYVTKVYIPSTLVMFVSFGGYWIPDKAISARIAMLTSTFLGMMFILQSMTDETAKISETTAVQLYLMGNIAFLVFGLLEYLCVLQQRKNTFKRKLTQPVLTYMNGNTANGIEINKPEHRHINDKDIAYSTTPVSVIDRFARIFVPTSYVTLCSIYYGYYLAFADEKT